MARRPNAKQEIEAKLRLLQADYAAIEGQVFDHFYCPMLFRDEPADLCRGHIINKAFANTSRAWTVQRRDIDMFFGRNFEADFVVLGEAQARDVFARVFDDSQLHAKLSPRILLDGKEVEHVAFNAPATDKFTPVGLALEGSLKPITLKMNSDAVESALEGDWQIEIDCDLRLSAFVSLLKAAHLSLFETLGYRYALSVAGHFLGKTILGDFFLANLEKAKPEVLIAAKAHFPGYAHMIRPVAEPKLNLKGTVADRQIFVCRASSGGFWGQIVFVRTGDLLHSVILPIWDNPDKVPVFLDFLQNDHEEFHVSLARHNGENWEISPDKFPILWTKKGCLTFT